MKKIFLSITLSFLTLFSFAQEKWCATDEMLEAQFEGDPVKRAAFFNEQAQLLSLSAVKNNQNNKAPTIIVPVVVHVIHDNGTGNILKAQVEDGIRVLNEDFQRTNSDTNTTRAIFKPYAADTQIEFRLARLDPNGNCTEGINRINSSLSNDASNTVKATSYWPATKYMNIWLVNSIAAGTGGTTLGYAQFPSSGNLLTYGVVNRHDEWGTIGTASGSDGRTATHELGHCFSLFHIFQSSCGSFCNQTGDFVCDTPPQSMSFFGCNTTVNSCSNDAQGGITANPNPYTSNVADQTENYMSYNDCQSMFSAGQKARMQASFSVYAHLNTLRSAANLIATGTNNGYVVQVCPPRAEILDQNTKLVCQGGQLSFDEQSYDGPITTYDWEFPGATPLNSSSATPTVTYNTAGYHDVILRVSNASGADTLVIPNYVHVDDTALAFNGYNYNEGFESITSFNADWITIDLGGSSRWFPTSNGSSAGSRSVWINNFNGGNLNDIDYLISPSIDLTQVINPTFKFKLAYKTMLGVNDVLKCAVSLDCGQTWITRLFINSGSMNSGTSTINFIPTTPSDWRDFTVTLTSAIQQSKNVMFRFDFKDGGGNNLYIDEFRVDGLSVVGIENSKLDENSFQIYPNPSTDGNSTMEFKLKGASAASEVFLTDIIGKRVQTIYTGALTADDYKFNINTSGLNAGVYFISLRTDDKRITKKLVVR